MADEKILIDVEYDTGEAAVQVDELTQSIEGQKVALSQLQEQVKLGQKSQVEASKESEKIKTQLQKETKQRKDLIKIVQSEKGSRDQLRQSISQLIRERNSLNMNTAEGRKRAEALRKEINKLDKQLQKTGTTTEKAKGNIGKYGDSLNALPGPIGGVITSVKAMSKVLLATPLGWLIGAIAAAGAALKTFFTGSAEGQERWNKTINKAKGIMSVFKDELINVGKGISNFTDNLKNSEGGVKEWASSVKDKAGKAWDNLKNDVKEKGLWDTLKDNATDAVDAVKDKFDELGDRVDENVARAEQIAEQQNRLRRQEIDSLTDVAELRRDISNLRADAADKENVEASERLKMLDLAINKENEILAIEEELAAQRIAIQKAEMAQGENRLEDYERLAELEKAQIDLETTNADRRRRLLSERVTAEREVKAELLAMQEESLVTDEEMRALENEIEAEQTAEHNAVLEEIDAEHAQRQKDLHEEVEQTKTELTLASEQKRRDAVKASLNSISELAGQATDFAMAMNEKKLDAELSALNSRNLSEAESAKERERIEKEYAKKQKKLAVGQALIKGALVVLNALTTTPFIPLGLIAAASAAITTGFQIAKIKSTSFGNGGQVPLARRGAKFGTFSGASHSAGGVQLYTGSGQHVAEVEGNENFYVVNKKASSYINSLSDINQRVGGGVPLTSKPRKMQDGGQGDLSEPQPFNINDVAEQVVRRLPPIVVRTEDVKTGLEDRADVVNVGVI